MDFTGARRRGREDSESAFWKDIALALIAKAQPEIRYHPLTHEEEEPNRGLVVRNWRQAGYALASHLVPKRKGKRFPVELESFVEGLRMRLEEYEQELGAGPAGAKVEIFDVGTAERIEERAEKFLRLATHERTPPDEARNAALALARMLASSELAVLAWERVRHFSRHLRQMQDLFAVIRHENPLMFYYGAREQLGKSFTAVIDDEFGHGPWR